MKRFKPIFAPAAVLFACHFLTLSNAPAQVPPSLYPPPAMIAGTAPTGDSPSAVAVNPVTHNVYIANVGDQTLTVLDGIMLRTLATLPLGVGPYSIAVDPITYRIYVTSGSSQTLTVINGVTNTIAATVMVPDATVLTAVVVDSLLARIYVLSDGGYLSIFNGEDNTLVSIVQVASHPRAMALNYFNHKLYIASYDIGSVTVVNSKGVGVGYIKNLGSKLTAIAVDPYADCAFVVSQGSRTVTRINGGDSYSTFTYTGFVLPVSIAFDPGGAVIYVGDGGINQVAMVASGNNIISRSNLPVLTADALAIDSVAGQLDIATHNNYVMALDLVLDPSIFIYNEFPTGASPYAIAVDPITHRSFVTNQLSNTVTVLDAAQHTITLTPPNVPLQATAVDVNPVTGTLYFLNPSLQTVTSVAEGRFDTSDHLITATIPVGAAQGILAVNPVTNKIYVPNAGGSAISIIDGSTNAVTQVTGLPQFAAPLYAAVDPASNRVFAADFVKGLIYVIDGASGAVVNSISAPGTSGVLAINPAAAQVYTPGPNSLEVFDEISNSTTSIPVGTAVDFLAVNPTTNQIIVSNASALSTITVINGGTKKIAGSFTLPYGVTGLGVNPLNNKIYVLATNQSAGHAFVFDGASFAQIADVAVGSGPVAIGFNPLLDLAYVASTNANYLTVIDVTTEATEILYTDGSNMPSTGGSVALAFDPVLNMISAAGHGEVTSTRQSALFTPSDTVPPQSGPRILIQSVLPVTNANTIATTPLFRTSAATATFNVTADSDGTTNAVPEVIYYQVDRWSGTWNFATPTTAAGTRPTAGTVTTPSLSRGLHYLYVWSGTPDVSTVQSNGANQNSSVASPVTAVPFSIEPADTAASIVAFLGSNQRALLGEPFASPLVALVKDAAQEPVAGVAVTFTMPASASSASFSGMTSVTAVTNSSGAAVSPVPVANLVLGSYNVIASAPGAAMPASFALSNVNPGPPVLALSASTLKFAAVAGTTTAAQTVKLLNSGPGPLAISSITVDGPFALSSNTCASTLAPSANCTIAVIFKPAAAGVVGGAVTIAHNGMNSPGLVALDGTGVNALMLQPASLSFGSIAVGSTSAAQTLTLNNYSASTIAFTFHSSAEFSVLPSGASPCGASLVSGASCTVAVTFSPAQNGTIDGSLSVTSAAAPTFIAPLSGSGTGGSASVLTFSPASLTFGIQATGTTSAAQTVTITNTGASAIAIASFTGSAEFLAAAGGATPCASSLAGHAQCTFTVRFAPSAPGLISGSALVSAGTASAIYNVTGTALSPVSVYPAALTFAAQAVGTTSAPQTITVINLQSVALALLGITSSGEYHVSPGGATPCGASVPAESSCTLQVTFTPVSAGNISGAVTIFHNAATGNPLTVTLTGQGM